jgi:hypothetical protein
MSTIKRVVLCVALLSAAANGLRFGDRALDPREDVDAASSSKEDFASRLADSAGKAALLADADTTLKETVEGSSEIGKKGVLKTTSGAAKAVDTEASASGVADELHKTKGVSEGASRDVVGASTGALRRL